MCRMYTGLCLTSCTHTQMMPVETSLKLWSSSILQHSSWTLHNHRTARRVNSCTLSITTSHWFTAGTAIHAHILIIKILNQVKFWEHAMWIFFFLLNLFKISYSIKKSNLWVSTWWLWCIKIYSMNISYVLSVMWQITLNLLIPYITFIFKKVIFRMLIHVIVG